jgi:hypothetical protein
MKIFYDYNRERRDKYRYDYKSLKPVSGIEKFLNLGIVKLITWLCTIGFIGLIFFIPNIHWSHHIPFSRYTDFQIDLDEPGLATNINYYTINDTFSITYILSNKWKQPIDVEFDFNKNDCVIVNYSCVTPDNKCPKSPNLNKTFLFREIEQHQTQYITVNGKFINCTGINDICLMVDEPKFHPNKNRKCVKYNPSQLKI